MATYHLMFYLFLSVEIRRSLSRRRLACVLSARIFHSHKQIMLHVPEKNTKPRRKLQSGKLFSDECSACVFALSPFSVDRVRFLFATSREKLISTLVYLITCYQLKNKSTTSVQFVEKIMSEQQTSVVVSVVDVYGVSCVVSSSTQNENRKMYNSFRLASNYKALIMLLDKRQRRNDCDKMK